MSDQRLKQLRAEIQIKVAVLCLDSGLFNSVSVDRFNAMLTEIKELINKYAPDPPGMVKP